MQIVLASVLQILRDPFSKVTLRRRTRKGHVCDASLLARVLLHAPQTHAICYVGGRVLEFARPGDLFTEPSKANLQSLRFLLFVRAATDQGLCAFPTSTYSS
jgi:hypothetical protein